MRILSSAQPRPLDPFTQTDALDDRRRVEVTIERRPCVERTPTSAPLVLVVDDHEDSRVIARVVLEAAGFRVCEAACGVEALSIVATLQPDVVLLDLILPGIDGWEVARRLRTNPDMDDMAIIALTALAQPDERGRARDAGCDDVLTKPVSPAVIARTVRRFLTQRASAVSAVAVAEVASYRW
jgi:CheY-like chemotaxis protein